MKLEYLLRKVDSAVVITCKDYVLMWIYMLAVTAGEVKQEDKLAVEYVSWYHGRELGGTQCLESGEAFLNIPLLAVPFPSSGIFIKSKDL